MPRNPLRLFCLTLTGATLLASGTFAGVGAYEPTIPIFQRGNQLNSAAFLAIAEAQKPRDTTPLAEIDIGRAVTSSLIARITADIATQILDGNSGMVDIGGQNITYSCAAGLITVVITGPTGSQTIQFPASGGAC